MKLLRALALLGLATAATAAAEPRYEEGAAWTMPLTDARGGPLRLEPGVQDPNWRLAYGLALPLDDAPGEKRGLWEGAALLSSPSAGEDRPLVRLLVKTPTAWTFRDVNAKELGPPGQPAEAAYNVPLSLPDSRVFFHLLDTNAVVDLHGLRFRFVREVHDRDRVREQNLETPSVEFPGDGPLAVRFVRGLYWPTFRLDDAVTAIGARTVSNEYVIKGASGRDQDAGRTPSQIAYENLLATGDRDLAKVGSQAMAVLHRDYRDAGKEGALELEAGDDVHTVVLVNVKARAFELEERLRLHAFVEQGGTLVYLAGPSCLREAWSEQSFFEDLLPFERPEHPGRWQAVEGDGGLEADPASDLAQGLAWEEGPRCFYLYDLPLKPSAAVHVRAGRVPVLVEQRCGQGRVLAWTATVLEDADAAGLRYWNWKGWPALLGAMMQRGWEDR